jgi:hypothetical protein
VFGAVGRLFGVNLHSILFGKNKIHFGAKNVFGGIIGYDWCLKSENLFLLAK